MISIVFYDYATERSVGSREWPAAPATGDLVSLTTGLSTAPKYRGKVTFIEWLDDGTAEIHLIKIDR